LKVFLAENEAQMMLLITMIAWLGALIVAWVLRSTVIKGEATPFVMELPPYRMPTLKGILIHTWERTWQYIQKAGTVILGISIIIWAMMTFPGLDENQSKVFEDQRTAIVSQTVVKILNEIETLEREQLSDKAVIVQKSLTQIDLYEAKAGLENWLLVGW
jgi:ferrous iron transport protein B